MEKIFTFANDFDIRVLSLNYLQIIYYYTKQHLSIQFTGFEDFLKIKINGKNFHKFVCCAFLYKFSLLKLFGFGGMSVFSFIKGYKIGKIRKTAVISRFGNVVFAA